MAGKNTDPTSNAADDATARAVADAAGADAPPHEVTVAQEEPPRARKSSRSRRATKARPEEIDIDAHLERDGRRVRGAGIGLVVTLAVAAAMFRPDLFGLEETMTIIGLLIVGLSTWVFVFVAAQLLVDEPVSELVHVLFGERLGVRGKLRFLNRLEHECKGAHLSTRNRAFSVVVIGATPAMADDDDPAGTAAVRSAVRRMVRARDVLGDAGTGELWLLALGANEEAAAALGARLRTALRKRTARDGRPRLVGWSTFEIDSVTAEALIDIARDRGLASAPADANAAA
jgi:hypothetical protein